jgi:hypothetical protein
MDMEYIDRNEVTEDHYKMIFEKEAHHDHKIRRDENGVLFWKGNRQLKELVACKFRSDFLAALRELGLDKNDEIYRKFYRDMGVSLFTYWESFYWEVNNPKMKQYRKVKVRIYNCQYYLPKLSFSDKIVIVLMIVFFISGIGSALLIYSHDVYLIPSLICFSFFSILLASLKHAFKEFKVQKSALRRHGKNLPDAISDLDSFEKRIEAFRRRELINSKMLSLLDSLENDEFENAKTTGRDIKKILLGVY